MSSCPNPDHFLSVHRYPITTTVKEHEVFMLEHIYRVSDEDDEEEQEDVKGGGSSFWCSSCRRPLEGSNCPSPAETLKQHWRFPGHTLMMLMEDEALWSYTHTHTHRVGGMSDTCTVM